MITVERKVDDVFDFEEKKLLVSKATKRSCDGCFFESSCCRTLSIIEKCGHCASSLRFDKENVIFKEVSFAK